MKPTVLIVDDNVVDLKLVSYLLGLEGYRVLQAEDAETALDVVHKFLPDLLLLDLGLPGMDGHALLRLLRGDEKTKYLRVVAMTAHAMKGSAEKSVAEGFDDYITKPIDTRRFLEQVSFIISKISIKPLD